MMSKNWYFIFPVLFFLAFQLAVPISLIHKKEKILKKGTRVLFKTRPIDPVDPFRGRYVILGVDNQVKTVNYNEYLRGGTVYVTLEKTGGEFHRLKSIHLEPPEGGVLFIKTKVSSAYSSIVRVRLPFDRYYIEESLAMEAEMAYRKANREGKSQAHISVKVLEGDAVLEELFIEDKPVMDYLRDISDNG